MRTVGWVRGDPINGNIEAQAHTIRQWAKRRQIDIEWHEVTAGDPGPVSDGLLQSVSEGQLDCVVVASLDSLGHRLGEVVTVVDTLVRANVRFVALAEHIDFRVSARSPVISLFGHLAAIAREAPERGRLTTATRAECAPRRKGRPRFVADEQVIEKARALQAAGRSVREIAKTLEVVDERGIPHQPSATWVWQVLGGGHSRTAQETVTAGGG
jgi:DNA invertase Pin-like site-specific DNA recombinase